MILFLAIAFGYFCAGVVLAVMLKRYGFPLPNMLAEEPHAADYGMAVLFWPLLLVVVVVMGVGFLLFFLMYALGKLVEVLSNAGKDGETTLNK